MKVEYVHYADGGKVLFKKSGSSTVINAFIPAEGSDVIIDDVKFIVCHIERVINTGYLDTINVYIDKD